MGLIADYLQIFFLWSGFIWSLYWHITRWIRIGWIPKENDIIRNVASDIEDYINFKEDIALIDRLQKEGERTREAVANLDFFASAIALCTFGYFAFGSIEKPMALF